MAVTPVIPKPKHLGPEYGDQFRDKRVAEAYVYRPPYSSDLFDILESLIPQEAPRIVLDMGCGTGEIAVPLAGRVDRVDAVDPSEAMLKMARTRPGWDQNNIRWVCRSAEDFDYSDRYSLIVAGASLHWMDWDMVLPKMGRSLRDDAFLAICSRDADEATVPWQDKLGEIIPRYSTNQDFEPYVLFAELKRRSLFQVTGCHQMSPVGFRIRVEDYVEMIHSQNGFSRERMTKQSAAAFDAEVVAAVAPYASDEELFLQVTSTVTWGRLPRSN